MCRDEITPDLRPFFVRPVSGPLSSVTIRLPMLEDVASIVQLLNRVSRIQWRSHPPEFIVKFEQELLQGAPMRVFLVSVFQRDSM